MEDIYTSQIFWAAFAALVAFATLLGVNARVIIIWLNAGKLKRLQASLDKERKLYEMYAMQVATEIIKLPEESAIESYLTAIKDGVLAIAELPDDKREKIKDKVRKLISELQKTHETLVRSLKLFTTNSAKIFFDDFEKFNDDFDVLYQSGTINNTARTHCSQVVEIVNEITESIAKDIVGNTPDYIESIRKIGWSMEYADQKAIVPIMQYILSKTKVELSLIKSALLEGDKYKAIWLKERYRFDIAKLYKDLNNSLTNMSDLVLKL